MLMKKISITGIAGFIGYHLQEKLRRKHSVRGIDSLGPEFAASHARSKMVDNFSQQDCSGFLDACPEKPDLVIHLAAHTGIKKSYTDPESYIQNNVLSTFQVLEQCRKNGVKYLIYASSSSVYEPGQAIMREDAATEHQLSFYGTTKKMSEIMVENYCRQYGMTAIGLRFFTVYGSWTRTDMAAYIFMESIAQGKPITLYNNGNVYRDFTHVSDIVGAIALLVEKIFAEQPGSHQVFNIGYGAPVSVHHYASLIAAQLGKELLYESRELPENELESTHCDPSKLESYIGFKPRVSVEEGVKEMTDWYLKNKYA